MMTPSRFGALARSYGADLRRWPEGLRAEAEALLKDSFEARALFDEARALDDALSAAQAYADNGHAQRAVQDVALIRLRLGVDARIAALSARGQRTPIRAEAGWWRDFLRPRWWGLATSGGLAVVAGLYIGAVDVPAASPDFMQMMLQPDPITIFTE
jgi:hypothetical protein